MKRLKIVIYLAAVLFTISAFFMHRSLSAVQIPMENSKDKAEMIYIPEGEFLMGSPYNRGDADEQPQRKIYLDKFYIYKYEVTVSQYKLFCKETGYKMPPEPAWGWVDMHPIVNVSRYDAQAYCKWAGVSLPTEAQWEKAARGTEGRPFPWGHKWDTAKFVNKLNSNGKPAVTGSYPESGSPYGVMDMAGNVWEWVADGYDEKYYTKGHKVNPYNPPLPDGKGIIRGGSWNNSDMAQFRTANRCWFYPDQGYSVNGFRCVFNKSIKNK